MSAQVGSLISTYAQEGILVVEDVERGYVIGVRGRDANYDDPMTRPDPELEAAFSRYVDYDFDVVEFLGSSESAEYPFAGGRLNEWLDGLIAGLSVDTLDLFILASAGRFVDTIREACELRSVSVDIRETRNQ